MSTGQMQFGNVPIEKIFVGRSLARTRQIATDLNDLSESIKRLGLLSPIIVAKKRNNYELVVGHRRLLAVKALGWKEVPSIILSNISPEKARIISLSDNINAIPLSLKDVAHIVDATYAKLESIKSVAQELGISEAKVRRLLSVNLAPEPIKQMMMNGQITALEVKKIQMACGDDEKRMLLLAKEMQKLIAPQRRKLIELAEAKTGTPVKKLLKEARKPPSYVRMVIHLDAKRKAAFQRVAKESGTTIEDMFARAITEWLASKT